jgi:hypothetical protein
METDSGDGGDCADYMSNDITLESSISLPQEVAEMVYHVQLRIDSDNEKSYPKYM